MKLNMWLRRLWFINGIIFLVGGSIYTFGIIRYYRQSQPEDRGPMVGARIEKAIVDSVALQDVSLSLPRSIGITPFRFIQITAKDLTTPIRISKYSDLGVANMDSRTPDYTYENNSLSESGTINLLFIKADGSDSHLLLDKKGFIQSADIPRERDSVQLFNIYRIIFSDTDGDGRLTAYDKSDLFCSDLNGHNLSQITNDSIRIITYTKVLREQKLYIKAKVRPSDSRISEVDWNERIFVYNIKSNQMTPFIAEEGILNKVRQMLWSK